MAVAIIRRLVVWTWCFPQQMAGLILKILLRPTEMDGYYAYSIECGSLSLGEYIFLCPAHQGNKTVLSHEQGHTKQSYILGWLWVPLIGIPSLIWAGCFGWLRKKYNIEYYSFYTEKTADMLGGVKREQ